MGGVGIERQNLGAFGGRGLVVVDGVDDAQQNHQQSCEAGGKQTSATGLLGGPGGEEDRRWGLRLPSGERGFGHGGLVVGWLRHTGKFYTASQSDFGASGGRGRLRGRVWCGLESTACRVLRRMFKNRFSLPIWAVTLLSRCARSSCDERSRPNLARVCPGLPWHSSCPAQCCRAACPRRRWRRTCSTRSSPSGWRCFWWSRSS